MNDINPRHRSKRLEKYIGQRIKVTFKDGHGAIGVLEHKGWRYGMNGCDWFCMDSSLDHHIFGWFMFCHSNVHHIEVL